MISKNLKYDGVSASVLLSTSKMKEATESKDESSGKQHYIFVKDSKKYRKLMYEDIVFIKAAGSYCEIETTTRTFTLTANMKSVLEQIDSNSIIRCHRGFAVNLDRIKSFDDSIVELDSPISNVQLPVSLGYRSEVMRRLPRLKSC